MVERRAKHDSSTVCFLSNSRPWAWHSLNTFLCYYLLFWLCASMCNIKLEQCVQCNPSICSSLMHILLYFITGQDHLATTSQWCNISIWQKKGQSITELFCAWIHCIAISIEYNKNLHQSMTRDKIANIVHKEMINTAY